MKLPQIYVLIFLLFCLACKASKNDVVEAKQDQKTTALSAQTSKSNASNKAQNKAPQKATQKSVQSAAKKSSQSSKGNSLSMLNDRQANALKLVEARDLDAAEKQIDQLLAGDKSAANYFLKGRLHIEKKQGAEAVEVFKKAMKVEPKNATIIAGYAWALMSNYKYKDAIDQANLAHNLDRENDLVHAVKGYYFFGTQNYQEAEYNFNKAITSNPNVGHYYYARARVYNAQRKKAKACDDMRSAKAAGYGIPQSQIDSFCASPPPKDGSKDATKKPIKLPGKGTKK